MQKNNLGQKVVCYVGNEGQTLLRCPGCKTTQKINVKKHHHLINTFKTVCACGFAIRGKFDFRHYYRKKVCLSGYYLKVGSEMRSEIRVENISGRGVGFSCLKEHNLQKGEYLDITFTLDNLNKSTVTLWMEVMNINNSFVGAKRCDTQLEQPDLDVYLR